MEASESPPTPPEGWWLISPADAVEGDGVLLPDGTVVELDARGFGPFPIEVRRRSWAVRQGQPERVACTE